MADTLSDLQTRLLELRIARDSGVLAVRHGDTSTTYRSLNELLSAIALLEGEINRASGRQGRPRVSYPYQITKGY